MKIPKEGKEEYIKTHSHSELAKKWGVSLLTLDTYAKEEGWDQEHKLYWRDIALEVLKKETEAYNLAAVKELLKAVGISRPVGRPPKAEVDRHIAIEARIANEYKDDVERLNKLRLVKD
ncbi:hypothetical protein [Frateuria sp. STR12]|uniref:hypothetical protein n=1 Tax=Frateuria hangzhouensis TaxID=2995589 RepID=UPI002260DE37|nr:hypothetical protein [Frateuria sp. STR12]MCX7515421.1 hypothetical protein [Frateuria sp. STR12]